MFRIASLEDDRPLRSHSAGIFAPRNQRQRISEIFGIGKGRLPRVDDDTLLRYYHHLAANLSFPIHAYYPEPANSQEEGQFGCTVLGLLDPIAFRGDAFDGILCKIRKGRYEMQVPLIELELLENSPCFQLVEDYWYWFWNWR